MVWTYHNYQQMLESTTGASSLIKRARDNVLYIELYLEVEIIPTKQFSASPKENENITKNLLQQW